MTQHIGIVACSAEGAALCYRTICLEASQRMGTHRQVGVVGCASVAEYDQGRIKKHENTRPDKEDDRTRHIEELRAKQELIVDADRSLPIEADGEVLGSTPVTVEVLAQPILMKL